ncbi:hypothetical protein KAR91_24720 [Candidatus Pacearchaeota archaeon]|nr:hypothetical protein [Candidatus Pacearchaeota archaeon]
MKLKAKTKKKILSLIKVSGVVLNVGYKGAVLYLLYQNLYTTGYIAYIMTATFG